MINFLKQLLQVFYFCLQLISLTFMAILKRPVTFSVLNWRYLRTPRFLSTGYKIKGLGKSTYATAASKPDRVSIKVEDESYQFLPRSALPSYYFQKSLPRLPIPKLEMTCQRYLECVENIMSSKEFEKTKQAVLEFQADAGIGINNNIKVYS